jgi:hypothetical protein
MNVPQRQTLWRHANAMGLTEKCKRNVRAALERIIERVEGVEVTGSTVVSLSRSIARSTRAGQWIDRTEQVSLNDLFDRMSREELEDSVDS